MNYKKIDNNIFLRLNPGDDIIEKVLKIAELEDIKLAQISGIGATDDFEVGVFNLETNAYDIKTFTGNHEIVNLCGTLTTKDGQYYSHLHITCANSNGECVGGHLLKANISLTAEIIINISNEIIDRKFNEDISINQ